MGTGPPSACAPALHDSDNRAFSMELSMAAVFSFGSRDMRGRSLAPSTGIPDPGFSGARPYCHYGFRDANPADDWLVRFSAHVDFSWARSDLVPINVFVA
jgi:hypothetical protein